MQCFEACCTDPLIWCTCLDCWFLAVAVIKGCMKVGLNLLIITVHPMKPGATLMSSFLFNTALVLLATNAAIQFCAQAFALYANETAIQQIWGGQVMQPCCLWMCSGHVSDWLYLGG